MKLNRYILSLPQNISEEEIPKIGECVFRDDEADNLVRGYISKVFNENNSSTINVEIILFEPISLDYLEKLTLKNKTSVLFYELLPEKQVYDKLTCILKKDKNLFDFWYSLDVQI